MRLTQRGRRGKVSRFPGCKVSRLQGCKVSRLQRCQVSFEFSSSPGRQAELKLETRHWRTGLGVPYQNFPIPVPAPKGRNNKAQDGSPGTQLTRKKQPRRGGTHLVRSGTTHVLPKRFYSG